MAVTPEADDPVARGRHGARSGARARRQLRHRRPSHPVVPGGPGSDPRAREALVPSPRQRGGLHARGGSRRAHAGAPLLRRLPVRCDGHRAEALLHGQGRAVEPRPLGRLLLTLGAFPVHRESGRPRGPHPCGGGAAAGTVAGDVPRGRPSGGSGRPAPPRGSGVPRGAHRGEHRPHGHRRLGSRHAQGIHHPQAPARDPGARRAGATARTQRRRAGVPLSGARHDGGAASQDPGGLRRRPRDVDAIDGTQRGGVDGPER